MIKTLNFGQTLNSVKSSNTRVTTSCKHFTSYSLMKTENITANPTPYIHKIANKVLLRNK